MHAIITALEAVFGPIFEGYVHTTSDTVGNYLRDAITVDLPIAVFNVTVSHTGRGRTRQVLMSYTQIGGEQHERVNPSSSTRAAWAARFVERHGEDLRWLEDPTEGPTCTMCDGLGHGYPGSLSGCPLENRGVEATLEDEYYERQFATI